MLESDIIIDDIKVSLIFRHQADIQVKGVGKSASSAGTSVFEELKTLQTTPVDQSRDTASGGKVTSTQEVYVCPPGQTYGERVNVPVFELEKLDCGDVVTGPALVIDATQTIFINA